MNIEELNRIGNELRKSPLFNLSLASKELFHSNFLSWLSVGNWNVFVKVMSDLAGKRFEWKEGDYEVCREDDNFDLSVRKDNKPVFVLENKVKSIPTEEQLNRYTDKIQNKRINTKEVSFVLLSLTKLDNCPKKWKQRKYSDLSGCILRYLNDIVDCYHRLVVMDYCTYINNLQSLADNWEMTILPSEDLQKLLKELRLNDVYQKATCSFLCKELERKLSDNEIDFSHIDKFEEIFKEQYKSKKVFTRYDMSHGDGLFEVIIKVDNIWKEIMIQGSNYQHMIYGEEDTVKSLFDVDKKKPEFVFDSSQYPEILKSDLQGDGNKKKGYNSYSKDGYLTIYKYKKIDDVNDNDAILNAIVNEVRSF